MKKHFTVNFSLNFHSIIKMLPCAKYGLKNLLRSLDIDKENGDNFKRENMLELCILQLLYSWPCYMLNKRDDYYV